MRRAEFATRGEPPAVCAHSHQHLCVAASLGVLKPVGSRKRQIELRWMRPVLSSTELGLLTEQLMLANL